jgi:hypothetical protein
LLRRNNLRIKWRKKRKDSGNSSMQKRASDIVRCLAKPFQENLQFSGNSSNLTPRSTKAKAELLPMTEIQGQPEIDTFAKLFE